MPRTNIASGLQRLADASRSARLTGTDTDEAVGRQREYLATEEGFTRRQLLAAGVVGTAAASSIGQLILARRVDATPSPRSQPTIAVIGAGISGMSAAMTLRDAGLTRNQAQAVIRHGLKGLTTAEAATGSAHQPGIAARLASLTASIRFATPST